ncbi:MAG: hypothetical protein HUU46_01610 [Candidatus Hydrogenedentes bacterium]|nr:hypothetical protein [Candidatus Hydrogenedentota bacterium]
MKMSKAQIVGVVAILIGAWWSFATLVMPMVTDINKDLAISAANALVLMPILAAPGLMAFVYGFKVLRHPINTNITRAIGSTLFVVTVLTIVLVDDYFESLVGTEVSTEILILIATSLSIQTYILVATKVRRSACIPIDGLTGLFSMPFLFFVAVIVWVSTFLIIGEIVPQRAGGHGTYLETAIIVAQVIASLIIPALIFWKLGRSSGHFKKPYIPSELHHT